MKRIISLVLTIAILCAFMTLGVTAESQSSKIVDTVPRYGELFYYDDAYFEGKASDYNPSLATVSMWLASVGAGYSWLGWENQSRNLQEMLQKMNFTDIEVNEDFKEEPGPDTMGVAAAVRKIGEDTLLAIVLRSMGYRAEWASNFTIGESGDARGFSDSCDIAEEFIEEYVRNHPVEGTLKLWIVGYSRGAAIANLLAGRITTSGAIDGVSVEKENIFGYTFNTPAALSVSVCPVEKARQCTNIHNIITANDLVPKVAPSVWGFYRYGTDESLIPEIRTDENTALFDAMVSHLPGYLKTVDETGKTIALTETYQGKAFTKNLAVIAKLGNWVLKDGVYVWEPVDSAYAEELLIVDSEKPMSESLDDLTAALANGIGSRKKYTGIQDAVRLAASEYMENVGYQTAVLEKAKAILQEELQEYKTSILIAAATGRIFYLEEMLYRIVQDVIAGSGLDAEAYIRLPQQMITVIPFVAKAIVEDIRIDGGADVLSIIENLDILIYPHYSEQCIAWLMVFDPNYRTQTGSQNARVSEVEVSTAARKETKKLLFRSYTSTVYDITINPVSSSGKEPGLRAR